VTFVVVIAVIIMMTVVIVVMMMTAITMAEEREKKVNDLFGSTRFRCDIQTRTRTRMDCTFIGMLMRGHRLFKHEKQYSFWCCLTVQR
jgi:hypothetical protein